MSKRVLLLVVVLLAGLAGAGSSSAAEPASKPAEPVSKWQAMGLSGGGGLFNPSVSPHDPKTMLTESDMGGRYITHDGGQNWQMLHYSQITAACNGAPPLFHPTRPGVIYTLSENAANVIHVSGDNGVTWQVWPRERQPKAKGVISRMFIDSAVPGRLYVGTGQGQVLSTDDDGATWREVQLGGKVIKFVVDQASSKDARRIVVGTAKGVFVSSDGGATFQPKTNGLPADKPLQGFAGGSDGKTTILYATLPTWVEDGNLRGGVYVSTDLGETWKCVLNPQLNVATHKSDNWGAGERPRYVEIVANDANPRRAYVWCDGTAYFPPFNNTIYRTDDAGASWTSVWFIDPRMKEYNVQDDFETSFLHQSWTGGPLSMEISPTDPDVCIRTDGMWLHQTRDAGKGWLVGYTRLAEASAAADKDRTWLCNGLVMTTTWNYYIDPHQPNRHYIGYTDIGFARSLDGGKSWRWWGPGPRASETGDGLTVPRDWINTTYELAFDPAVPGRIWGAFSGHHDIPNENSIWRGSGPSKLPGGVCVSDDFGQTWTVSNQGLPVKPCLGVVLDPKSPKGNRTLYAAVYDEGVYKSTDDGKSWTKASSGLGDPANTRICRIQLHPDGTLFALVTGMRQGNNGPFETAGAGLYRSRDAGANWEKVNAGYDLRFPKDFAVDPDNSDTILIGACDAPGEDKPSGGLHRTDDGGKIWSLALRMRPTHFGAYYSPHHKGWIYATGNGWSDTTKGGIWLSKDDGKTWSILEGMPFPQVHRVAFDPADPSVIYLTTFGGSVWKGPAE